MHTWSVRGEELAFSPTFRREADGGEAGEHEGVRRGLRDGLGRASVDAHHESGSRSELAGVQGVDVVEPTRDSLEEPTRVESSRTVEVLVGPVRAVQIQVDDAGATTTDPIDGNRCTIRHGCLHAGESEQVGILHRGGEDLRPRPRVLPTALRDRTRGEHGAEQKRKQLLDERHHGTPPFPKNILGPMPQIVNKYTVFLVNFKIERNREHHCILN